MSEDPQGVMTTRDPAADALVVRASGDMDHESAPRLAEAPRPSNGQAASRTVVDLSRPVFADSSVLHVLLDARRDHPAQDALMVVADPLGDTVLVPLV